MDGMFFSLSVFSFSFSLFFLFFFFFFRSHFVPLQQAPPPQYYQPIPQQYQHAPPMQQFPPTQQSSIQIPVGSAPPKVVSTACIYPSQPGESAITVQFPKEFALTKYFYIVDVFFLTVTAKI